MTVVAVLSMKGGVGKSTVALGLASAAWDRNLRTLVIDLDPQANASMALDVDGAEFTTSDVLADARPGVAADAVVTSGWGDTVAVIAAERSLEHRNVAQGRNSALRLRTALATLPRSYDLVVIDCPPSLGELTRNALSAADRAIVVTEPNHFALHGATEALEAIDVIAAATNPGLKAACVVVNRFRPDDREHRLNADRLAADPGGRVYGVPSVKARWWCDVESAGNVGTSVFWPVPHVDSGLVRMTRREPPSSVAGREAVFAVVDAAFSQRRKTLRSSLAGLAGSPAAAELALRAAGVDPGARGEQLGVVEFARVADALARGRASAIGTA